RRWGRPWPAARRPPSRPPRSCHAASNLARCGARGALDIPQLSPRLRMAAGRELAGVVCDVDGVHLKGDAVRVDSRRVHISSLHDTGIDLLVEPVRGPPPQPGATWLDDVPLRVVALDLSLEHGELV